MITTGRAGDGLTPLFAFGEQSVALDAVKLAENGEYLIVRLHEYAGQHTPVTLTPQFAAKAIYQGALNETVGDQTDLLQDGKVQITLRPYQILTLCVTL